LIERVNRTSTPQQQKNTKETTTTTTTTTANNNILTKTFAGFLDNVIGFTKEEEDSDYSDDDEQNINGSLKKSSDDGSVPQAKRYILVPRCYCFISRFPFFKTHYAVLYGLTARERLRFKNKPPPVGALFYVDCFLLTTLKG